MGAPPDATIPLLVIAAMAVPLAAWKAVEIVLWVAAHVTIN